MLELLSILLYLNVICSPCEYYEDEIEQFETDNQEQVDYIMDDPDYLDQVVDDYGELAELVEVNNRNEDEVN